MTKKIPLEEQAQGVYELCVCTATWGGRAPKHQKGTKGRCKYKKNSKLFLLSMLIEPILFCLYN